MKMAIKMGREGGREGEGGGGREGGREREYFLGFVQPAYFYGDHARLVWERVKLLSTSMKRCST